MPAKDRPVFSLLSCLHMLPGRKRLGLMIKCSECNNELRTLLTVRPMQGTYTAICHHDGCDYRKATGSSKLLADLYSAQHSHHGKVHSEWTPDDKQDTSPPGAF